MDDASHNLFALYYSSTGLMGMLGGKLHKTDVGTTFW